MESLSLLTDFLLRQTLLGLCFHQTEAITVSEFSNPGANATALFPGCRWESHLSSTFMFIFEIGILLQRWEQSRYAFPTTVLANVELSFREGAVDRTEVLVSRWEGQKKSWVILGNSDPASSNPKFALPIQISLFTRYDNWPKSNIYPTHAIKWVRWTLRSIYRPNKYPNWMKNQGLTSNVQWFSTNIPVGYRILAAHHDFIGEWGWM